MKTIDVDDAKADLPRLLELAHSGEEIVITEHRIPLARLCPLVPPPDRKPGLLKGELGEEFFEPLPEEELDGWKGGP